MAKAVTRRRKPSSRTAKRSARGRKGWVRKNLLIDQRKLNIARRALGAKTETEAIDLALDSIAFGRELARGIEAVRRSGGVVDVFGDQNRG